MALEKEVIAKSVQTERRARDGHSKRNAILKFLGCALPIHPGLAIGTY
jgi:hypothetical protein